MKNLPEVGVDRIWSKTLNYIFYKLVPNDEFILKSRNNHLFKTALNSILYVLCDERKFYKKVKRWVDTEEIEGEKIKIIKVHLMRIGVDE